MEKRFHPEITAEMKKAFDGMGFPRREGAAPLETVDARYADLLNRLGVQGHDGAIAEIDALRRHAGMTSNA